jgi:hypothetical protein
MNTYLKISLGGTVLSKREFSKKGNDNVEYFQAFELAATLPGSGSLHVAQLHLVTLNSSFIC